VKYHVLKDSDNLVKENCYSQTLLFWNIAQTLPDSQGIISISNIKLKPFKRKSIVEAISRSNFLTGKNGSENSSILEYHQFWKL
jgi:hypothetical protein